jgi:hypothetical protein
MRVVSTPSFARRLGFSFERSKMPIITIDNKEYDVASLSDEAKSQLASIQFVDSELARLQAKAAALQTARMAYSKALQAALPAIGGSDTLKL